MERLDQIRKILLTYFWDFALEDMKDDNFLSKAEDVVEGALNGDKEKEETLNKVLSESPFIDFPIALIEGKRIVAQKKKENKEIANKKIDANASIFLFIIISYL